MRTAEELRYLVLAVQREGNRVLAAELKPLGVTPSQAEVVRVLSDHQPLTLAGLGELLVCETGGSPSRLVDRLVARRLVHRQPAGTDRRQVALTLTGEGERVAALVRNAEEQLYRVIDELTRGEPVREAITILWALAAAFPAGQALARRTGRDQSARPGGRAKNRRT